jgi:hypothetical protein
MRTPYHFSPLAFGGSLLLAAVLVVFANLPLLTLGAAVVA